MTTLTPEELITTLEATSQFNDNADICMEDIIATLQAQAERINELEAEAEQLRKGITICTVIGREIEVDAFRTIALVEYGELCRKQALEEAVNVCETIEHDHLDTYKHKPGPNAYDPHFQGLSMGAGECADKIGELLK
jgi:hypothetical protein